MELYMMNRQHGRMILESTENGPLIWPSIEENRVTRPKKYSELSATEEIQANCDVKAKNIILQGLPPKTTQDLVINKMQKKVKRLEKALRARTLGMKLFKISTSRRKGLDKDNVSKQERKSDKTKPMFKDSDFDVLDDAMENVEGGSTAKKLLMLRIHLILLVLMSARPRITSVVIRNVEEEPMRATPVPTVQSQDKEQAQFKREQRIARERATKQEAKDAVLIEQIEDVQARMDADELLAARLQEQKREQFFIDEQARFLVETIAARKNDDSGKKYDSSSKQAESSKRPRAEHDEESVKKEKLQDDAEKEELRACLDIVQGDDIAIDVESLATKYPIVDWKTHILTENMMYYQIIKADGSSKNYKIFSEMLDDFDKQDVMDLHRLVKERYDTTSPEGYDLLLWGDLKTLFEPCEEDEVWRNQQGYNLIS
ncbi:hypothetical protein Tco_1042355 [Tanacetum coccineum]|uniref:Uncharacterized protein n=1 Tax=Tanacetum coccineum TaxID=301880 RepID=A0ABQ5GK31_9ASTR